MASWKAFSWEPLTKSETTLIAISGIVMYYITKESIKRAFHAGKKEGRRQALCDIICLKCGNTDCCYFNLAPGMYELNLNRSTLEALGARKLI